MSGGDVQSGSCTFTVTVRGERDFLLLSDLVRSHPGVDHYSVQVQQDLEHRESKQ